MKSLIDRPSPEVPALVVNPITGAMVPLDAATDELAEAHDGLGELASQAKEAQGIVERELLARMDKRGKWTAGVGAFKLQAPSPSAGTERFPNPRGLREDLLALARAEVIDRELVDDAAKVDRPAPVYKAVKAGIAALRKLGNPQVDAVIEKHAEQVDPPARRVKVKRKGS